MLTGFVLVSCVLLIGGGYGRAAAAPTSNDAISPALVIILLWPCQPDAEIRVKGVAPIVFVGGGIYNNIASQTVRASTGVGQKVTYFLRLFNYGDRNASFKETGPAGGAGWTVAYFDAATGGKDITAQVTGAGWTTRVLKSKVYLDYIDLRVEVTPDSTVANGASKNVLVTFTSNSGFGPAKVDAVLGVTTLVLPPK